MTDAPSPAVPAVVAPTFTVKAPSPGPATAHDDALARLRDRAVFLDTRARFLGRSTSPATVRTYGSDLRHFFVWLGIQQLDGEPSLDEVRAVTWRDVARYRDRFFGAKPGEGGLALATGARRLSVLATFYRTLRDAGLLADDPTRGLARPRAPEEGRTRGLSPDEVNRILAACPRGPLRAERDRLFLGFLFFEWLRIAEACRLRVEDTGEDQGIPVARVRTKGARERTLVLRTELARATVEYARRFELSGFLFPSLARGRPERPITPDGARRLIWAPAVRRAGLDPALVSPHSARVAGITAALVGGAALVDVQDFAGHSRPETTLRYHRARRRLDRAPVAGLPFRME